EHAAHVNVHLRHQPSEVGRWRLEVPIEAYTRVVHQHIKLRKMRLHVRREGGDLSGFRDVALDCAEFRVFRLHLFEHRLAPTGHDDIVAEVEELEAKERPMPAEPPVMRMVRPVSFMRVLLSSCFQGRARPKRRSRSQAVIYYS